MKGTVPSQEYSIRSERLLVEQEPGAVDRLGHRPGVFCEVLAQARDARLLSGEHFSVDGTLLEAWASMGRFALKGGVLEERRRYSQADSPSPSDSN